MTQKVLILKGLPASGKSTYAKELIKSEPGKWKRINKDLLREMLDGGIWSKQNEEKILKTRDALISLALSGGHSVIIDDTNFAGKHIETIKNIVDSFNSVEGIDIEIEEKFFDVPVYECIERDKLRGDKSVGEKVILKMYKDYVYKPVADQESDLPECVIIDIDGTLAYKGDRGVFDYTKVSGDIPNKKLIKIVNSLPNSITRFIVSGRDDNCMTETSDWLIKNGINYHFLLMRKTSDNRDDSIVKREIFEENIKGKWNVVAVAVFDDRPRVIRMWKDQGLFVLDANRQDSRVNF